MAANQPTKTITIMLIKLQRVLQTKKGLFETIMQTKNYGFVSDFHDKFCF